MNLRARLPIATMFLMLGIACATTPGVATAIPSLGAENSAGAIRAAEEVGAAHTPEAALYLQLAKEEFEHARKLTGPDDQQSAARLLLRAQADADLSLALARENAEKLEAQADADKVKTLNESVQ
jgi:hypothetical protein